MADDSFFISAGLIPPKTDEQPITGDASMFVSAGLTPAVEEGAPPVGLDIPIAMHHYKQIMGVN